MIDQIRHLQSVKPFETFALELAIGRVIQIDDPHMISTTEGSRHGAHLIGTLYQSGIYKAAVRIRVNCTQIDGWSQKLPRRGRDDVKRAQIPLYGRR